MSTGWARDRDSRIVSDPGFRAVTARLWAALHIHEGDGTTGVMTRAGNWTRVALIVGAMRLIELLCHLGVIKPLTMIAPSQMALELARRMIASGELTVTAAHTFTEVGTAFAVSVAAGAARWGRWCMRSRACAVRSIPCWRAGMRCRIFVPVLPVCWWRYSV